MDAQHTMQAETGADSRAQIKDIADKVRAMSKNREFNSASAIEIVRAVGRVSARWDIVEAVVEEIAKGPDGVIGTDDDLIPQKTLESLRALLDHGVVKDITDWISGVEAAGPTQAPSTGLLGLVKQIWAFLKKKCCGNDVVG